MYQGVSVCYIGLLHALEAITNATVAINNLSLAVYSAGVYPNPKRDNPAAYNCRNRVQPDQEPEMPLKNERPLLFLP